MTKTTALVRFTLSYSWAWRRTLHRTRTIVSIRLRIWQMSECRLRPVAFWSNLNIEKALQCDISNINFVIRERDTKSYFFLSFYVFSICCLLLSLPFIPSFMVFCFVSLSLCFHCSSLCFAWVVAFSACFSVIVSFSICWFLLLFPLSFLFNFLSFLIFAFLFVELYFCGFGQTSSQGHRTYNNLMSYDNSSSTCFQTSLPFSIFQLLYLVVFCSCFSFLFSLFIFLFIFFWLKKGEGRWNHARRIYPKSRALVITTEVAVSMHDGQGPTAGILTKSRTLPAKSDRCAEQT